MRDAFIFSCFGSLLEINVRNSSSASRGWFLATIKDEAAQKYTGTNVSFKVCDVYVLSSRLCWHCKLSAPCRHLPLSLFLSPPFSLPWECSLRLRRWFRANHVSRLSLRNLRGRLVARAKVRKEGHQSRGGPFRCYPREKTQRYCIFGWRVSCSDDTCVALIKAR